MKIENKRIVSWSAVILWMLLIFAFSAQPAVESEKVSHGLVAIIIRYIGNLITSAGIDISWLDGIVRKSAHAFLFCVLAVLVANALLTTGVKGLKAFIFAFVVTVLYACSDELHQLFVPGRAGMLSDVAIDSLGAIAGLCLTGAIYWITMHKEINISEKFNTAVLKLNLFKSLRSNS